MKPGAVVTANPRSLAFYKQQQENAATVGDVVSFDKNRLALLVAIKGPEAVELMVLPGTRGDVIEAMQAYSAFTGQDVDSLDVVTAAELPDVLYRQGTVLSIEYTCERLGQTLPYRHEFRRNSRPELAVSPDGRSLHIFGGAFRVTAAGITDTGR